ncbi:hypothetical protein I5961_06425 [Pseudomonas sp. IAC-BECa141]|nr:hypothetical protein I5961_06425 [Pseudomonas sp. IAC-BECa141]
MIRKDHAFFIASRNGTRSVPGGIPTQSVGNDQSKSSPPAATPEKPIFTKNTQSMVGQKAARKTKKRATEVAQNALRAHQIQKNQRFLRLFASFQIKNPNPAKNRTIRPTVRTPANTTLSKNMTGLLAPALLRWNQVNQSGRRRN